MKIHIENFFLLNLRLILLSTYLFVINFTVNPALVSIYMCIYLLVEIFILNRMNYLIPAVAFNISWFLIFFFSLFHFSTYTRPISISTIEICSLSIIVFNIFSSVKIKMNFKIDEIFFYNEYRIKLLKIFFISFCILNISLAGYIPFFKLLMTGDSGYLDFGVKGLYGLFLAFSNAFGVLLFFIYLKYKRKNDLYFYLFIFVIFLLFMTRQNLISLFVESFFVYTIMKGRIQIFKSFILLVMTIGIFGVLGDLRSGDIKDLAGILPEYQWLPTGLIWVYCYFYFNILNFDNLVNNPLVPFYDLSSLSALIPSFIRGESNYDLTSTLELINFNIASYMYPLYADMGKYWVVFFSGFVAFITKIYFDKLNNSRSFVTVASCAVLYFCALMSFFVNFWTYLPIIFQLIFIPLLYRYVFIKNSI